MRIASVALLLGLAAASARADQIPGLDHMKLADESAARGDFVGAATHYKAAYALDPRPELICNTGVAYYKANDATRAHLYLSRCQERGTALDATFVAKVRSALAAVETLLRTGAFTPVDVVTRPEGATVIVASLGDDDAFVGPRLVWLPRGAQSLTVRAEGYLPKTVNIDAQGTERLPIEVTLDKTTAPTVTPPPVLPEREKPSVLPDEPHHHRSRVPAYVAIGGSVAAFVLAGVAYSKAHDAADMSRLALSPDIYEDDKSRVTTWNRVMTVSGVVGLLGAGLASYLIVRW